MKRAHRFSLRPLVRIRDDRHRLVESLIFEKGLRQAREPHAHSQVPAAVLTAVQEVQQRLQRNHDRAVGPLVDLCFAVPPGCIIGGLVWGSSGDWRIGVLAAAVAALLIWFPIRRFTNGVSWRQWPSQRPSAREIAHALRRHVRCGACAYDLTGLDPHPDGCTVCPECGAAWRLEK